MGTKKPSGTKKKSITPSTANIKEVKQPTPVEEVAEVAEAPVITLEERHMELNKFLVMNYVDILSAAISENKNVIIDAFLANVPEEKRESYIIEARQNTNVRIVTYEHIAEATNEVNGPELKQNDAFTHLIMMQLKERLQGFENESITSEIVPLLNCNGQVFVVFREAILMTIAASEKVRKAIGKDIVAAICLNNLHFSNAIIDVFLAHIGGWMPSFLREQKEAADELRTKFLEVAGGNIVNLSLKVLTVLLNTITVDPQHIFASIVGQENLGKYFWGTEINVTSPRAVSVLHVGYIEVTGDVLGAMMEE